MTKSTFILTLLALLLTCVVSLAFVNFNSGSKGVDSTSKSQIEANADSNTATTNNRDKTIPGRNQSISTSNPTHSSTLKVITFTQDYLIEKFEISVTDDEIKNYIKAVFDVLITEEAFIEIKESVDAQIAAAEDVIYNSAAPEEAANRYLHKWGGSQIWADMLNTMNEDRLNEIRSMAPSSISDMYEKSVPGHRRIVEGYELAKIIFKDEELDKNSIVWQDKYYEYLINYAKGNLIGKVPELMDINIDELRLYQRNSNTLNQSQKNNIVPPLDRSKQNSNVGSFQ